MRDARPPRLATWLLNRRLPGSLGESIRGDLEERWQRDRAARGRLRADLAYWRDALQPGLGRVVREGRALDPAPGASVGSISREGWAGALARDVKHAVRVLAGSPVFTTVAVLSLALGIGPNTAVFSLVDAVLLRAPEGRDPESLVDLYVRSDDGRWFYTGYWNVERLRENADDVFEGVAGWVLQETSVGGSGLPEPATYELVTGNYFDVLGLTPARGRFFLPEEDVTPGTHPVVVVSWSWWQRETGGDPGVVGSEIRLASRPYTVVGVAPEGFTGKAVPGVQAEFWVPYHMYPHLNPGQEGNGNLGITARIRDGVSTEQALAAVEALSARIDAALKAEGRESDFVLRAFPWTDLYLHPDRDGPLVAMAGLLLAVVGLVLVVACVNLAGFLLARSTDRRREIAVRLALGAGRGAVVRQLMVESALLGAAGGAVGLALGLWTARALVSIEPPIPLPLALDVGLDLRVLVFTAGVSVVAALLFGLLPALRASRGSVSAVLRDEGNATSGARSSGRLRNALVVGQMAVSVILLVGAGLFIRSLQSATALDPGFDTGPAALVDVNAGPSGYETGDDLLPTIRATLQAAEAEPGLRVEAVTRVPLGLGSWVRFYDVPGVDPPPGRDDHRLEYASVSSGYFDLMDIRVVEGRTFDDRDRADGAPVAVVSAALARAFWPGESAVGRTLVPRSDPDAPITVVGVAEDVRVWSLEEPPRPYLYLPFAQAPSTYVSLVARGSAGPEALGQSVVELLRRQDPDLFVPRVRSMEEHLAYILFLPRMAVLLVGSLSILALVLAAVGLYGVVSYGVAARTREMGIRFSLGAGRGEVVAMVVRRGVALAAAGAILGVVGAMVLARYLSGFLIGVPPWDPLTLVAVPAGLLAVAAVAAFLPARRASRVDPVRALRSS